MSDRGIIAALASLVLMITLLIIVALNLSGCNTLRSKEVINLSSGKTIEKVYTIDKHGKAHWTKVKEVKE